MCPLEPSTHIDDEYSRAGIMDPKIVITTSRDPSSKLLQFAKASDVRFRMVEFYLNWALIYRRCAWSSLIRIESIEETML